MATYDSYWAIDADGTWSTPGNWWTNIPNTNDWENTLPGDDDIVNLTPTSEPSGAAQGTSAFKLTFNTTATIYALASPSYATLSVTGGTLTVLNTINLAGPLDISGGTLDVQDSSGAIYYSGTAGVDFLDMTGGTLKIDAGVFATTGENTLAGGNVTGGGEFEVGGTGSMSIDAGAEVTTAIFELAVSGDGVTSGTTLYADFSYSGDFLLDENGGNNSDLYLNGHTFTLSGSGAMDGTVHGGGELLFASGETATFSVGGFAAFYAIGGVKIVNKGEAIEVNNFQLGGSFDNQTGGTYDFTSDAGISSVGSVAFTNEGTLEKTVGTGSSFIYGAFTNTGVVDAQTGAIGANGSGGKLGGVIEGGGFYIEGFGAYTLSATLSLTVGTFGIDDQDGNAGGGATVTLGKGFTYGGTFNLGSIFASADLNLVSYQLLLTGAATITAPYGYVDLTGTGVLRFSPTANASMSETDVIGGVSVENFGTFTDAGNITLDSDQGTAQSLFENGSGGVLDFGDSQSMFTAGGTAALITNAGTIDKIAGGGDSDIKVALDTTGTLEAATGAIWLYDGGMIGGTLSGAASIALRGGGAYTLETGLQLQVAYFNIYDSATVTLAQSFSYGGTFYEAGQFSNSTLDLAGYTLTLTGSATFTAAYGAVNVTGGGEIMLAKGATAAMDSMYIVGGVTISNAGTLTDDNSIELDSDGGSQRTLFANVASGIIDLAGDGGAFKEGGTSGLVTNAGLIDTTANTGESDIYVSLTNTGKLEADASSTQELHDGGQLGGTLAGAGTIALTGSVAYTLMAGLKLSVSYFDIINSPTVTLARSFSYGGVFYQSGAGGGGSTLDLAGYTFTLTSTYTFTAPYSTIYLTGGGQITFSKTSTGSIGETSLASGMTLSNAGTLTDYGYLYLDSDGHAARSLFTNLASGTVDLADVGNAFNQDGTSGLIANAGLIDKTAGTGDSDFSVFLNNTGTLEADTGSIYLYDGATLGGKLTGVGGIVVRGNSEIYTLEAGVKVTIGYFGIWDSSEVTLAGNLTFGGTFYEGGSNTNSTLNLAGYTLTLNAGATFTAPYGNVNLIGGGEILFGQNAIAAIDDLKIASGMTLANAGTLTDNGYLFLDADGGSAQTLLKNEAAAVIDIGAEADAIAESGTSGLVTNAGTIDKNAGAGESDISVVIQNTGTIESDVGTLGFTDGGTLGGKLTGAGAINLEGGQTTFNAGALISVDDFAIIDNGTSATINGNVAFEDTFNLASGATLAILSGDTLTLAGAATLSGTVSGHGTLTLDGGPTTIASSAAFSVSYWSILGAGTIATLDINVTTPVGFDEGTGATLTIASDDTLTLTGPSNTLGGTIDGAGSLFTNAASSVSGLTIGGSLSWQNTAEVLLGDDGLTVGDASASAAAIVNTMSGVIDITGNGDIARGTATTSHITNNGEIEKTAGTGGSAVAPNIINGGTVSVTSGALDLQGAITGTGSLVIGGAATLQLDGAVAATQTVSFTGADEDLKLDDLRVKGAQLFHGAISGFAANDTLDVGIPFGSGTHPLFTPNSGGTGGTLMLTDGTISASITLNGSYVTGNFAPVSDGNGGTMFTYHSA